MARKNYKSSIEIKVDPNKIDNKNITIRVGAPSKKNQPETVSVTCSFWLRPKKEFLKKEGKELRMIINRELQSIYTHSLKPKLSGHPLFPFEKDNIFIKTIPENVNYNSKRNYVSIELYLHTKNLISENKIPLCAEKNTILFDEAVKLGNILGNTDILRNKSVFEIHKSS